MRRKVIPAFSKRRKDVIHNLEEGMSYRKGSFVKSKHICSICGCDLSDYISYSKYRVSKSYTRYNSSGLLYVNLCNDIYSCQREYLRKLDK